MWRLGSQVWCDSDVGVVFISSYFEFNYPRIALSDPPPVVEGGSVLSDISYYYAGSQRIAMRIGNEPYFLFGDHLGSTSVVLDASGQIVEKGYYLPWGGTRGDETITSTDYAYTGQMREGDIYYYGARWPKVPEAKLKGFDPDIGRFMQADTIVPLQVQGTQAFDRYAYVNNNPLRYTDPSGHYYQECGDDFYGRCGTIPPNSDHGSQATGEVAVVIVRGWNLIDLENQFSVFTDLMPETLHIFDTMDTMGNKIQKTFVASLLIELIIISPHPVYLVGYSAGADSILMAYMQLTEEQRRQVAGVALLEATYTASVSGAIYQTNSEYLIEYGIDMGSYLVNISTTFNEVLQSDLGDQFINITPSTPLGIQGDAIQRHNYLPFYADLAKNILEKWGLD